MPVKGLAEPVEVFELSAPGRSGRACRPPPRAGSRRFVGRDAELQRSSRRLERARAATARSWRWSASRASASRAWSRSLSTRTARQGWLVLEAGVGRLRRSTSYLPVIDLLKALLSRSRSGTTRDAIREKVTGKLLRWTTP